jgi:hypothetical protein
MAQGRYENARVPSLQKMKAFMMRWCLLLLLVGCGGSARDVFAEAEALEREGKLEEAATKFQLTCAHAPKGDSCNTADGRAAEARIKAAEKAIGDGQFARAERLFAMALVTADETTAKKVADRMAAEEMKQGLAYQRALAHPDKKEIAKAMDAIAATNTPVAAQAKAWIEKERPGLIIAAVKAACGPAREGSCSKVAAELKSAAITGAEADAAVLLAEEEERRVYPLRMNAEGLLQNFVEVAKRDELIEGCKFSATVQGGGSNIPGTLRNRCQFGLGTSYVMAPEDVDEQIQKRRANDIVWRRAMKSIADPELVAALELRKSDAQNEKKYEKLEIRKPASIAADGKK